MSDNSRLILSALLQTDSALALSVDATNSWVAAMKKRGDRVAKYRRYERGEHSHSITNQMRKMLRLPADDPLSGFSLNYCRIIVDKMTSRLNVAEITTDDETQDTYINELLERNDFSAMQGSFFRSAVRDGDSYVMVDPATLYWSSEPAYDGFSGIVAIFNANEGYPLWACKLWSEADTTDIAGDDPSTLVTMKMLVYQPDRITAWRGSMGAQDVISDGEEQAWTLGNVPIIHFANLVDSYTQYGESELRVAIPTQDVINRTLHSMVMASEFSAFKVAWSIGMELDKSGITPGAVLNMVLQNADGTVITDMSTEQIAFLNACRVGEFAETDISQYTNQIEVLVKQISQISQTPIYGVTSDGNLSGEALKQLEIGLIGKVRRFQRENTGAIRLLIELTAAIQMAFDTGMGNPPELEGVSVNWASSEIVDANAQIAGLVLMRKDAPGLFDDNFYRQRVGGLLEMSQAQIKAEGENADAARANEKLGLGTALASAMREFDRGGENARSDDT